PRSLTLLFHDTPTTQISPLSLHDALPISKTKRSIHLFSLCLPRIKCVGKRAEIQPSGGYLVHSASGARPEGIFAWARQTPYSAADRKSTRLNSSHVKISYAVFCLKKKKK